MSQPDAFCMMPWVHLHVGWRGRAMACCNANIVFGDINKLSIDELWNAEAIRNFRLQMRANQPDPRCEHCYAREAAGTRSLRQETNDKYAHHSHRVNQTTIDGHSPGTLPVYLDLRWNNICNFRCRTCWHGASSRWFEEGKTLKKRAGKQAILQNIKAPLTLFQQLEPSVHQLEEIYFAGGEPLLMEEQYLLLEWLLKNQCTHIHLRYNTNFSKLSMGGRDILSLWRQFPNVTVDASIDATKARGALIRKEQSWSEFVENVRQTHTHCPHVRLGFAPTISALNLWHLPDLHKQMIDLGIHIDAISLNPLHRPAHYNIKILPQTQKEACTSRLHSHIDWLKERGASTDNQRQFLGLIDYLHAEDLSHLLPTLQKETALLDQLRQENTLDTLPELAPLLTEK